MGLISLHSNMSESNNSDKTILVTGGTGYIGSHTVLQLLKSEYKVVVVDNLSNSSQESLTRVEPLAGKSATFVEGDLTDAALVDQVFADHDIYAVIHFAGLRQWASLWPSRCGTTRTTCTL